MLDIQDIPLFYAIGFSLVLIDKAIIGIVDLIITKYFSRKGITNARGGAAPGSQPVTSGTEQTVPCARFKEVNDALKAYEDLGFTADEVQEALVALAAFVEQVQAADRANAASADNGGTQPNTNGNTYGAWTQQQWEDWALQTFPWMRELKLAYEQQQATTRGRHAYRVKQSQDKLKALATKAGYSKEELTQLEDIIAAIIRSDASMMAAWQNGDLSVVEQAFRANFVEPVARN